ncbi:OmpA family protein [Novilysobacter spongiicola]|uniref:OmpA-OmpF porin, OOP family n=1 Tax=Lysobacter spongiicola DSM 21749 TaxID=1122188 RepID=A0A1T4S6K2_9GAMM|nr:OmpA family protein [Lysobacter spongiicola]SKA23884.1 OmpA-OmpF porin, OOP family [Lysobacter spongiicola DSM 21749]
MNKNLLCAALVGGLSLAGSVSAQEFDDRWYVTAGAGMNFQDNHRGTDDAPFGTIGVGKFINPNWSVDGELNFQNPSSNRNDDLNWSQYGISFDVRRHFIADGRSWNPYVVAGLGYQRSEEEFDPSNPLLPARFERNGAPSEREDGSVAGKLGFGVQGDVGRVKVRTELAYRAHADDDSIGAYLEDGEPRDDGEDWFGDILASVGVVVPLGPEPVAPVAPAPAPAAPNCADLDDDGDGVNNCDDRCPDSQAGQTIGPDGCPVPVSIDLKGVNFDFDKSTLRPDAVAILSEAVQILQRYPDLNVEVAGHTDLCGSDAYNQSLSERRANAVYDYLTSNGIGSNRLVGPNGYGESRPLESTPQTNPECRSETNRRTELNVQN